MRDVAAWLVARPQNAVAVLSMTMLVPILQPISGIALVLIVLTLGIAGALRQVGMAAVIFAVAAALSGMPWTDAIVVLVITWLPLLGLAGLMLSTRSFALTMQASVILATLIGVSTGVLIDDPTVFWAQVIELWLEVVGQTNGDAAAVTTPEFAENLGAVFVASAWFIYTLLFLAGYVVYGRLKEVSGEFGRIRDLNFGRVLAFCLVLMIVLSAVSGLKLFDLAAIVLFATFLLQGWALTYWIFAERGWPIGAFFAVGLVSVVITQLSAVFMMAGYLDVWFNLRRRLKKT